MREDMCHLNYALRRRRRGSHILEWPWSSASAPAVDRHFVVGMGVFRYQQMASLAC